MNKFIPNVNVGFRIALLSISFYPILCGDALSQDDINKTGDSLSRVPFDFPKLTVKSVQKKSKSGGVVDIKPFKNGLKIKMRNANIVFLLHVLDKALQPTRPDVSLKIQLFLRDTRCVYEPTFPVIHTEAIRNCNDPDILKRFALEFNLVRSIGKVSVDREYETVFDGILDITHYFYCSARYKVLRKNGETILLLLYGPADIIPISSWNVYITGLDRLAIRVRPGCLKIHPVSSEKIPGTLDPVGTGIALDQNKHVYNMIISPNDTCTFLKFLNTTGLFDARLVRPDVKKYFPWIRPCLNIVPPTLDTSQKGNR